MQLLIRCFYAQVRHAFSKFGAIANVRLIRDAITGAVKGIGFVEFESPDSVSLAVRASDSVEVGQRKIRIQPWKSIKKSKASHSGAPQQHQRSNQQNDQQAGSSIVVPSNLRGVERRKFVTRALVRKQKKSATETAKSSKKIIPVKKINKKEKKRRAVNI